MENYSNMSSPYLDGAPEFTTGDMIRSHPALAYPSPVPYAHHDEMSFVSPALTQGDRTPYASSFDGSFAGGMTASPRSSPEAPSMERGNKLLQFQPSTCPQTILDYQMRPASVALQSQLHGMFFLAESSRTLTGELASSPAELTCYRRNLFQITGSVTMSRMLNYVVTESGERQPIVSQELTISATESVEGSPIKIISVPWKTPANGTPPAPEEKTEKEPSSIPLDQSANHDVDAEYSVFPIAWKRLQFRVATANNGRRRELQQHFTIKLSVTATLQNGSKVSICDALSGPIIVRGRSPRNFQSRKDVPLSGSGVSMRKTMSLSPAAMKRSSTLDSIHRSTPKLEPTPDVYSLNPADALRRGSPTPNGYDWQQMAAPLSPYGGSMPDMSMRPNPLKRQREEASPTGLALSIPGLEGERSSAPPQERPKKLIRARANTVSGAVNPHAYIPSPGPTSSPTPGASFNFAVTSSMTTPSPYYTVATPTSTPGPSASHAQQQPGSAGPTSGLLPKSSQAENNELFNEYFPLGVEDWSQGENVYRPHVTGLSSVGQAMGSY